MFCVCREENREVKKARFEKILSMREMKGSKMYAKYVKNYGIAKTVCEIAGF